MTQVNRELQIVLSAKDKSQRAFGSVDKGLDNLNDKMKSIAGTSAKIGAGFLAAGALTGVGVKKAVEAYGNLETQFNLAQSTATSLGISIDGLEEKYVKMSGGVLRGADVYNAAFQLMTTGTARSREEIEWFLKQISFQALRTGRDANVLINDFQQFFTMFSSRRSLIFGLDYTKFQSDFEKIKKTLGKDATFEEITNAKRMLAMEHLTEVLNNAGDLTSLWAFSVKTLNGAIGDLWEEIGRHLMPVVQLFMGAIRDILDTGIIPLIKNNKNVVIGVSAIATAFVALGTVLVGFAATLGIVTVATTAFQAINAPMLVTVLAVTTAFVGLAAPILAVAAAFLISQADGLKLFEFLKKLGEYIDVDLVNIFLKLERVWVGVVRNMASSMDLLLRHVGKIMPILGMFSPGIKHAYQAAKPDNSLLDELKNLEPKYNQYYQRNYNQRPAGGTAPITINVDTMIGEDTFVEKLGSLLVGELRIQQRSVQPSGG